MKLLNILKRITHPKDWLLEKDIHDLTGEIEMMEKQLPAFKRKLDELKRRKNRYQDWPINKLLISTRKGIVLRLVNENQYQGAGNVCGAVKYYK